MIGETYLWNQKVSAGILIPRLLGAQTVPDVDSVFYDAFGRSAPSAKELQLTVQERNEKVKKIIRDALPAQENKPKRSKKSGIL